MGHSTGKFWKRLVATLAAALLCLGLLGFPQADAASVPQGHGEFVTTQARRDSPCSHRTVAAQVTTSWHARFAISASGNADHGFFAKSDLLRADAKKGKDRTLDCPGRGFW